jgi:Putative peptidoglycan binding domain
LSRETDSSPYPQDGGRGGGAAYPSGTPPYGARSRTTPNPQSQDGDGEPAADEPRTETTITTRVRINIPGSRPIPPVVVRTPVTDAKSDAKNDGKGDGPAGESPEKKSSGAPGMPPGREFPGPGARTPAAPSAPSAPSAPGGPGGPGGGPAGPRPAMGSGATPPSASPDPDAEPGPGGKSSDWFAPRKPPQGAGPQPAGPQAGGPQPQPGGASPAGGRPPAGEPPADVETTAQWQIPPQAQTGAQPRIPYLTDPPGGGLPGPRSGDGPQPGPRDPFAPGAPGGSGISQLSQPGPGPTPFPGYASDRQHDDGPARDLPFGAVGGHPGHSGPPGASGHPGSADRPGGPGRRPTGPTSGPAPGDLGNPQQPGGEPPEVGYRPGGDLSSDTLVSGIPTVPPPGPRVPDATADSSEHRYEDDEPAPAKRGRSKLVLLAVALVALAGVAYGAGLLLDHADIPNGTTVLGIDIGGKSKDEAIRTLDGALGKRATEPLTVSVGGKNKQLQPSVAGLGLDTASTVRGVAHRDYNPVTVVGSLFGGKHDVNAKFRIDDEKLRNALDTLAGANGANLHDGTVKFVAGKAVGVPGRPGQALDLDSAVGQVRQAYITRAGTGVDKPVQLRTTVQQPKVTQAEIDRAIREFGKPAMSGMVYVKAGAITVPFSPQGSLPKFLSMRPVDGKLEPYFDLPVLKSLYGHAFDGLVVDHGGSTGPITARDVAQTMLPALKETDPAKRVGVMQVAQ